MNGSCLGGCDVGVHGDKCDSGEFRNMFWVVFLFISEMIRTAIKVGK